tara:strand:- start:824 stop:1426 length:603 start_codon:yes stop_codon:yes gene_type:complete
MEKLTTLFEAEVVKRVNIETKIIRDEYKTELKKAKELYQEELLGQKHSANDVTKKIHDDIREEHQKQKELYHDELRRIKDDQRKASKIVKDDLLEARNEYMNKAQKIHKSYSEYLRMIAVNYSIPYKILVRDAPAEDNNICRGMKKGNLRCNLNGKYDGYCKHHHSQMIRKHTIELVDDLTSIASLDSGSKRLIDFNSVL